MIRYILHDLTTNNTHTYTNKKEAIKKRKELKDKRPLTSKCSEYTPKLYTVDEWMKLKGII